MSLALHCYFFFSHHCFARDTHCFAFLAAFFFSQCCVSRQGTRAFFPFALLFFFFAPLRKKTARDTHCFAFLAAFFFSQCCVSRPSCSILFFGAFFKRRRRRTRATQTRKSRRKKKKKARVPLCLSPEEGVTSKKAPKYYLCFFCNGNNKPGFPEKPQQRRFAVRATKSKILNALACFYAVKTSFLLTPSRDTCFFCF